MAARVPAASVDEVDSRVTGYSVYDTYAFAANGGTCRETGERTSASH
jgi:hypothetical protein